MIRAITISVCLSPAVRHPAFSLSTCAPIPVDLSPSVFLRHITSNLHSPTHFPSCHRYTQLAWKTAAPEKTTVGFFISKQLWISEGADSCQHWFDKQNSNGWITVGSARGNARRILSFFQACTKPNLVFHLLLGAILPLLKLLNLGEMNSNCRLFFIFLKPFLTKIFKAVFLSCYATLQPQKWEHAENVPNKYSCHRRSCKGEYERMASLGDRMKECIILSFSIF